jgi:hypothetical protein
MKTTVNDSTPTETQTRSDASVGDVEQHPTARTHGRLRGVPCELAPDEFEDVVEVFRILKRWRDSNDA